MSFASADRVVARIPLLWRALAAIVLLCGVLLALVESRAGILRSGTEVRLRTVPVDPRDLFRGDYVVLSYAIGTVPARLEAGEAPFRRGETVFVTLERDGDGFARATGAFRRRPSAAPGTVVIAGRVVSVGACALRDDGSSDCGAGRDRLRVAYGLESFFVPQGSGRAIETTDRARIEVVAAVAASGEAAIKRLLVDGKLVHAEPPY